MNCVGDFWGDEASLREKAIDGLDSAEPMQPLMEWLFHLREYFITLNPSAMEEFESIQEALCCALLSQMGIIDNSDVRQVSEEKFAIMLELIPELHHYCSAISEWNSNVGANGSDQDEGLEFIRRALSVKPTYRLETQ